MIPVPDCSQFTKNLAAIGYDEYSLRDFLPIGDIHEIGSAQCPVYLALCAEEGSQRSLATALWLLHHSVRPPSEILKLTGPDLFEYLLKTELLIEHRPGSVLSQVDLSPCLGAYFFHDPRCPFESVIPNKVYELGTDSYWLARLTPRKSASRALDLCTGSGIHAVLAARQHREVIGVDINPRAVEFARMNAHLNGVGERCHFVLGDLYGAVDQDTFDLITINPPFVPTPEKDLELHRGGGLTGEDISRRAVAGLPTYLRVGGTFAMVLAYPQMSDSTYLDRLHEWLGGRQGWGVAVISMAAPVAIDDYIATQVPAEHEAKKRSYRESYQGLGIVAMDFATVFIRRLAPEHPGFSVQLPSRLFNPSNVLSSLVEKYLSLLETTPQVDPPWHRAPRRA